MEETWFPDVHVHSRDLASWSANKTVETTELTSVSSITQMFFNLNYFLMA